MITTRDMDRAGVSRHAEAFGTLEECRARFAQRGGVIINNAIHINGGTFTDRRSVQDLAHKVADEIMHSVRMQGGLLPQI